MQDRRATLRAAGVVSLLTLFGLMVHGYHPYVEDGGLYVAGIRKLIDPSLYPEWTAFVTEHLRFSVFAPLVAGLVRLTHVPLEYVLLGLYCAGIWATLWATWLVAVRLADEAAARYGAILLMACWLTLPIAGTSLLLMDPCVTARSFSTPLVLAAIAWSLDKSRRSWFLCGLALVAAMLLHPLMGGYGLAAVVFASSASLPDRRRRNVLFGVLGAAALLAAGLLQWGAPHETADYAQAVASRAYWFPSEWAWYEQFGLIAPFVILALLMRARQKQNGLTVARAAIALGAVSTLVALCFSHQGFSTHLVARMQPLRSLQIVYELMILLLGTWLGETVLKRRPSRWAVALVALGTPMYLAQQTTLPNSGHIEWPWGQPVNAWEQAFRWVRKNTPRDALFALDAHYITLGRHEDAQCFRAVAERSALPDYSKDGGEASITPYLTGPWLEGQRAQDGLEKATDPERLQRLKPFGVSWVVLEEASETNWQCPYHNGVVKVCRLP